MAEDVEGKAKTLKTILKNHDLRRPSQYIHPFPSLPDMKMKVTFSQLKNWTQTMEKGDNKTYHSVFKQY